MKQEKVEKSHSSALEKCHRWNVAPRGMSAELPKKRFPRTPSVSKHPWSTKGNISNTDNVIATDTINIRPKTVSYQPSFRKRLDTVDQKQKSSKNLDGMPWISEPHSGSAEIG